MEEESKSVSRLQKKTAYDVVIQRYDYLVRHVDATRILPDLISSKLVKPDFSQYLDGERTDKDKMMALLRELIRSPMEGWFKDFVGALSKVPQYQTVVDSVLNDFTKLMEERQTHPPPEDGKGEMHTSQSVPASVVEINVSGVDEVMKKAMEEAQEGQRATLRAAQVVMKEAKEDHKTALSELQKANNRVSEAEKGKFCAEVEKRVLEEKMQEVVKKLSAADDKLRAAEMHEQLLQKEAQSYKDDVKEAQGKMEAENTQLSSRLAELRLQEETARERVQEVEGERAALESMVTSLHADVESGRREREEAVSSLEQRLADARRQQQMLEEELKVVWKELGEKQERLEGATRQLDELQSSHQEELSHLKKQLERTTSRMGALEKELAVARGAKEKLDEAVLVLKEALEKNLARQAETRDAKENLDEVVLVLKKEKESNLAEQAETKKQQEQKVGGLMEELEAAISVRNSLKEKHRKAKKEMERVRSDLAQTQAEGKKWEAESKAMKKKLEEARRAEEDMKKQEVVLKAESEAKVQKLEEEARRMEANMKRRLEQEVREKKDMEKQLVELRHLLTELKSKHRGKEEELEQFKKKHANCDVTKSGKGSPKPFGEEEEGNIAQKKQQESITAQRYAQLDFTDRERHPIPAPEKDNFVVEYAKVTRDQS